VFTKQDNHQACHHLYNRKPTQPKQKKIP